MITSNDVKTGDFKRALAALAALLNVTKVPQDKEPGGNPVPVVGITCPPVGLQSVHFGFAEVPTQSPDTVPSGLTGFLWWFCEFFAKKWWKDSQQIAQISETSPHKPCLRFRSVTQTCAQLDFGHMAMRYKKTRTNSWKTDDWIWTIWRGSAIGDALRPELRSEMLQIFPDTFTDISGSPLYLQLQDIWICERFL